MSSTIKSQTRYQAGEFLSVLEDMHHRQISGILYFTANFGMKAQSRSRVLVLRNGDIVYGGASIPDNGTFVRSLGKKLDRTLIETAVNFAIPKLANNESVRELLELVVRLRAIKWDEVESIVFDCVVRAIEQLWHYPGHYQLEEPVGFDLTLGESGRGLDWSELKQEIERRQQVWRSLAPTIPSMDAIPKLKQIGLDRVTDISARQQLQEQVDGKRSLLEIAEQIGQDPLELGYTYLIWAEADWITFNGGVESTTINPSPGIVSQISGLPTDPSPASKAAKRPLVLSVDDSAIVQTTIKRILSDRYEVMLANSAISALSILNANQVDLLLLDVTMPDIDGLEFCKTLRDIPKFKNLPIVMVTAKDTLVDKFKGFMAGSNQYLYKPIEAAHLLEVVSSLIPSSKT